MAKKGASLSFTLPDGTQVTMQNEDAQKLFQALQGNRGMQRPIQGRPQGGISQPMQGRPMGGMIPSQQMRPPVAQQGSIPPRPQQGMQPPIGIPQRGLPVVSRKRKK